MERIFSFLLFAGFFYLMMRFGCGSHMVHGHSRHDKDMPKSPGDTRDPVCGMNVTAGEGYTEIFKDREYRFCSRKCLDKFDTQPDQFIHT